MKELIELAGGGKCWRCASCGWVDCYSTEDLKTYGAPTECQKHYHENLVEIDLAEGWAVLADKAATEVRKAARALDDAKAHAEKTEGIAASLRAIASKETQS